MLLCAALLLAMTAAFAEAGVMCQITDDGRLTTFGGETKQVTNGIRRLALWNPAELTECKFRLRAVVMDNVTQAVTFSFGYNPVNTRAFYRHIMFSGTKRRGGMRGYQCDVECARSLNSVNYNVLGESNETIARILQRHQGETTVEIKPCPDHPGYNATVVLHASGLPTVVSLLLNNASPDIFGMCNDSPRSLPN